MKKLAILLSAAAVVAAAPAFGGGGKHMDMKAMDTNGDGMISKDEFMRAHEMKWDKMKKNSSGMVDMKDMEMMHDDKMRHGDKAAKDKAK